MWYDDLTAEPYAACASMFDWGTGRRWTMPHLPWLFDECADFITAGKLDLWLDYYNDFAGLK